VKTDLELAVDRARAYVRNRGWRVEPLTWDEVKVILDEATRIPYCECEES